MGNVYATIIGPAVTLYGEPPSDDREAVFDIYEKILRGYRDDALEATWKVTAGEYFPSKRNPWPAPAIFKKHADEYLEKQPQREAASWKPDRTLAAPPTTDDYAKDYDRRRWRESVVEKYGSMDKYLLTHGPKMKYFWDKKP